MRPSLMPPRAVAGGQHPADLPARTASASHCALTSLSLPEKPPIAATSAPSMTCVAGARLGGDGDRAAAVRAGVGERLGERRRRRRRTCRRRGRRRPGAAGRPPPGGRPKPPARRRRPGAACGAAPRRRGPAPGPPIPAVCGPPAGNVPLVAWPSVCADHAAGAISSAPTAAPSAIARRCGRNASAAAAAIPAATSTPGSHASEPGLSRRIISSRADARQRRRAARARGRRVPPSASCATPAPTSAAVNGASSET